MDDWHTLARAIEFVRVTGLQRIAHRLLPYVHRRWFPVTAAVFAFAATASMTVPVVPVLVSLVAIRRDRWRALAFWAVLGSTLAGTLFTCLVGHFGSAFLEARLPLLAQSKHWHYLVQWTASYGVVTLAAVAASPLAQTPVLVLAAVLGMKWPAVAVALVIGKTVKYGLVAALAAKAGDEVAALTSRAGAAPPGCARQSEAHLSARTPH